VGGHVDGGVGVGEGNAGEVPVGEEPAELRREEEGEKEGKEGQRGKGAWSGRRCRTFSKFMSTGAKGKSQ
jgi:hypothetical protein